MSSRRRVPAFGACAPGRDAVAASVYRADALEIPVLASASSSASALPVGAAPSPPASAAPASAAPASTAPPAPPEAIAAELGAVKTALLSAGSARFIDISGRFSFEDRAKINQAVMELQQKTGAKVWLLALPGKTDVNAYATIHAELKMSGKDVLLIFSGDKRHLHSQALPKSIGNEILKETNAAFYKTSQTTGVLQMLEQVGVRLVGASAPAASASTGADGAPTQPKKPALPLDGILVLVAVIAIGWTLLKNKTPTKSAGSPARSKPSRAATTSEEPGASKERSADVSASKEPPADGA
jgi:hypothetical protein